MLDKITANDANNGYNFGYSVSLYKNTAVVGAYDCNITNIPRVGCVYIFEYNNITNKWNQKQKLIATDFSEYAYFGNSVSIFKNYIIVGTSNAKQAYIFKKNITSKQWYQLEILTVNNPDASDFGASVDITENYAIVGNMIDFDIGWEGSCQSYIFTKSKYS